MRYRLQPVVYAPPAQNLPRPPPGHQINPEITNWYARHSFEVRVEEDDMSKKYPWLFAPGGLYSGIKCEYPCQVIDGVCVCPEE